MRAAGAPRSLTVTRAACASYRELVERYDRSATGLEPPTSCLRTLQAPLLWYSRIVTRSDCQPSDVLHRVHRRHVRAASRSPGQLSLVVEQRTRQGHFISTGSVSARGSLRKASGARQLTSHLRMCVRS